MRRKPFDFSNIQALAEKLQKESDRACAVLARASLDTMLEQLLQRAMVPGSPKQLFEGDSPLRSFATKIDLAYALALIGEAEMRDLHLLRKIGNEFAHDLDYSLAFTSPLIADWIQSLALPRMMKDHPILSGDNDKPRWRFIICCGSLLLYLRDYRMKNVKQSTKLEDITFIKG